MLRYIPPELLDAAWPIISPGLARVTAHSHDPDTPEQIRAAIDMGAAHLFVAFLDGRYGGFAVLRPEVSYTGMRGLHIWAAYSEGAEIDKRLAEIEEMAREQGFNQVTFSSNRKGWGRRLKEYEPTYTIFRKVLDHGR